VSHKNGDIMPNRIEREEFLRWSNGFCLGNTKIIAISLISDQALPQSFMTHLDVFTYTYTYPYQYPDLRISITFSAKERKHGVR